MAKKIAAALGVFALAAYLLLRPPPDKPILLAAFREGYWDVYRLDDDTLQNLTWHQAIDDQPAWSPDGKSIVFRSNREGNFDIYTLSGTEIQRLTDDPAADSEPAWGEQFIAFTSLRDGNSEIYILDNGTPRNLTNHPANDSQPTWAGDRLIFISDRDGGLNLYSMNADGSDVQALTSGLSARYPAWSERGIAFIGWDGRAFGVYLLGDDGTPQRLTDAANSRIAWSGRGLVMLRDDGVYACDVVNCQPTRIYEQESDTILRDLAWDMLP